MAMSGPAGRADDGGPGRGRRAEDGNGELRRDVPGTAGRACMACGPWGLRARHVWVRMGQAWMGPIGLGPVGLVRVGGSRVRSSWGRG